MSLFANFVAIYQHKVSASNKAGRTRWLADHLVKALRVILLLMS
jgi:hypothetical protein